MSHVCSICGCDLTKESSVYVGRLEPCALNTSPFLTCMGHFRGDEVVLDYTFDYSRLGSLLSACIACNIGVKLGDKLKQVIEIPITDLPLFLNEEDQYIQQVVTYRLEHPNEQITDIQAFLKREKIGYA